MNFLGMDKDDEFTRVDDSYEGGQPQTPRAFGRRDSVIGKDSDDQDSDRSAIDGKGDELNDWDFLRYQFLKSKPIKLDLNKFLDSNIGLTYLIDEIKRQEKENPIDNNDIGVHYQQHLEGWRYGPNEKLVSTMQKFMGKAHNYADYKPDELLHKHYEEYMTAMFKINAHGSRKAQILESSNLQSFPKVQLTDTSMETLRIGGNFYIIITGAEKEKKIQYIQIHQYNPKLELLEIIHQAQLSNLKLLCWTKYSQSWIQNGENIYYFIVNNDPKNWKIKYQLVRINLMNAQTKIIREFETEMTYVTKHNGEHDPNLTASVLFSHYNLSTIETNFNEHEYEEDEDAFINKQIVTICQEFYLEPQGERFMLQLRQIGNFDQKIVEKVYQDRRDGIRVLFLSIKAQTIGKLTLEHDMIIIGVEGDAEIWYNQKDDNENAKFVDYDLDHSDNHQEVLSQISIVLRHLATQQYIYYSNTPGESIGKEKDYLTREFHLIPIKAPTGKIAKIEKLRKLYEAQLHQARQRFQIRRLIRAFLMPQEMVHRPADFVETYEEKVARKKEEAKVFEDPKICDMACLNINLVFDWLQDHYTYIMHTSNGDVFIVKGLKKDRRYLMPDNHEITHPFMRAQKGNQLGAKQLNRNFNNLFISQYKVDERWERVIVYIDENQVSHKFYVDDKQSTKQIREAYGQLLKDSKFSKYSVLDKNYNCASKRFELADDNRTVKLRINKQSTEGLYIEIVNFGKPNRRDADYIMRQKIQIMFGDTQEKIDKETRIYQLQQLTQASNVYRGRNPGEYAQDYHWCFIDPCMMFARILEYRATWNREDPDKSKMELFGFKVIVFRDRYPALENHLVPYFNDENEIDGTQWNINGLNIQLAKFLQSDYMFHTDIASTGYKKYYRNGDLNHINALLFESRLSKKIQMNVDYFIKTERLALLEQQVRTCMNMVPHNMKSFRKMMDNVDSFEYDFFQPLENLNGQCLCDYYIKDPDTMQKEIDKLKSGKQKFEPSLIEAFIESVDDENLTNGLIENDWLRQRGEVCRDFYHHNTIMKTFDEELTTSSRMLVEYFLSLKKSVSTQRIALNIVPRVLAHDDDFDCMTEFFVALKPGSLDTHEEIDVMTFAVHQRAWELPKFSDEKFHMDKWTSGELMRTQLKYFIVDRILNRFEHKDKLSLTINVEHFSVEFQSIQLSKKMRQLWAGNDPTRHSLTEFEMADMLDKIVNKYHHSIDRYTAIRYMIDCQFDKTFTWMSFNCFIYIACFMTPFLLQIFVFADSPSGVIISNIVCLCAQIYFMILECIQMQDAGFMDYIGDTFNQVDLGMVITYVFYFVHRMIDQTSPLVPVENHDKVDENEVKRMFMFSILHFIIITQAFIKVMFYLRISEGFGLLVDCVSNCLEACIPFTAFLILWMILFAILFRVQGMGVDTGDYGDDLNKVAVYIIQTYRNSVGDDAPPDFGFWNAQTQNPWIQNIMCFIVWATWLFNSFLLMIILLNFLIAILCEAFDDVNSKAIEHTYIQRAAMNRETFLTLKVLGMLEDFEGFNLCCNCSPKRNDDPIDNAVQEITAGQDEIREQIDDVKAQVASFQNDVQSIKDFIKKEMHTITQKISGIEEHIKNN